MAGYYTRRRQTARRTRPRSIAESARDLASRPPTIDRCFLCNIELAPSEGRRGTLRCRVHPSLVLPRLAVAHDCPVCERWSGGGAAALGTPHRGIHADGCFRVDHGTRESVVSSIECPFACISEQDAADSERARRTGGAAAVVLSIRSDDDLQRRGAIGTDAACDVKVLYEEMLERTGRARMIDPCDGEADDGVRSESDATRKREHDYKSYYVYEDLSSEGAMEQVASVVPSCVVSLLEPVRRTRPKGRAQP